MEGVRSTINMIRMDEEKRMQFSTIRIFSLKKKVIPSWIFHILLELSINIMEMQAVA